MKKALVSVFDKNKIVEFSGNLNDMGFEIIATGKTATELSGNGIPVTQVSEFTGFQKTCEIKTLHPKIHVGIMTGELEIIAVNLLPLDMPGNSLNSLKTLTSLKTLNSLKSMDLGGVALIRSAIKNFGQVTVIVNPEKYTVVEKELKGGKISQGTRLKLALEASEYVLKYESCINNILRNQMSEYMESEDTGFLA